MTKKASAPPGSLLKRYTIPFQRGPEFFNHPEGYVEPDGSNWDYVYQYTDHLGNIRLSYSDDNGNGSIATSEIREENNYYPFGLKHKGYNGSQSAARNHKYGFGGKEEQDEVGLAWHDFGTRNYEVSLGRWMNIDPLAEQMRRHSPYNYAFNDPLRFVDPDGMSPLDVIAKDEQSKQNILNQLSAEDQKFVEFDENGKLNTERLNQANSDSGNLRNLKVLANSEKTFTFTSAESATYLDADGNEVTESLKESEFGHVKGITTVPLEMKNSEDTAISTDENINIFVSNELDDLEAAKTTSHETVHAALYEFKRKGFNVNPSHKMELIESPPSTEGILLIFRETNGLLKLEIDAGGREVINNFKKKKIK